MATKHLGRTPSNATELALFGQIPVGGTSTSSAPLYLPRWEQALALRSVAPAKAVVIGDSLAEGQGATTRAQRFVDVMTSNLRTQYGPTRGGQEYIPSFNLVQSPDSPWTTTTPATSGTINQYQTFGLGLKSSVMTSGSTITFPVFGDSIDLLYYTLPAGGVFSYSIDGAAAVNVSCVAASDLPAGGNTHIAMSYGSHSVRIAYVSGNVLFHGVNIYSGDYTSGIQVYDAGRYGALSGNFTSTADTGTANGTTVAQAHNQAVAAIAPQLVIIELGANDWLNDTGSYGPTYTQTNIQQLITQCQAYQVVPDILLLSIYQLPQSQSTSSHTWSEYCTIMDTLASSNTGVYRYDMRTKFGNPISTSLLRASDLRHPNDLGHAAMGGLLTSAVAPSGLPVNLPTYANTMKFGVD